MDELDVLELSGSDVAQRSMEEAEEFAAEKGLVAFFPEANEIFLDIDDPKRKFVIKMQHILQFAHESSGMITILNNNLVTRSKSGNQHVYLRTSENLSDLERVLVQTLLGSDPVKEALTLLRLRQHSTGAICLFETPEEAQKVNAWREIMSGL